MFSNASIVSLLGNDFSVRGSAESSHPRRVARAAIVISALDTFVMCATRNHNFIAAEFSFANGATVHVTNNNMYQIIVPSTSESG